MCPDFVELGRFRPSDDLWVRLQRNFTRLEEGKYLPDKVFQRERQAAKWPGDTEGRTVLALVLLARATGREPRYLDRILAMWPDEVNEQGYFGRVYLPETISEQQLSGHGWVLRALSELDRRDPSGPARALVEPILSNLALPTVGRHHDYPLDPAARKAAGAFSGTHAERVGAWLLSTDVGCDYIFLDGLVDACDAFGEDRLRPLIGEMVDRFLEMDLVAVRAQTHATLTACRALLRWSDLSGDESLVDAVAERFRLYTSLAWTEHYANFNWFGRPEWTEPCAIVDSLMVAMELWRRTGDLGYLDDAHLVYFNALGYGQRANGGFGCDNCPGDDGRDELVFQTAESHWCCTMRGGEGLARMAQYCLAEADRELILPFLLPGAADIPERGLRVKIESEYPHKLFMNIALEQTDYACDVETIALFLPEWVRSISAQNGSGGVVRATDGERWLRLPVAGSCEWTVSGGMESGPRPARTSTADRPRVVYRNGPLLLASRPDAPADAAFDEADLEPIFDAYTRYCMDGERNRRRLLFPPPGE